MKKIKLWFWLILLIFFPHIINLILFISQNGYNILCNYNLMDYSFKFCQIILSNIGFYATCFSMIWAINVYFKQQKIRQTELDEERRIRQEEIDRIEKENNEIRIKELEKFKDSFRPNFVLNSDGKKLMLLMKKDDLFIENVYFYSSETADGIHYQNLMHKSEIDLKEHTNNYFITAETLIGEKIIFGVVLNTVKVYKLLKDGCSPVIPNNFSGENTWEKISENWLSFNRNEPDENSENREHKDVLKEIDKNFMYKTVAIRERMALNLNEYMINIIRKNTVKDLFLGVLEIISTNKYEFSYCKQVRIIESLLSILQENLDRITINPKNIKNNIWEYIQKKVDVANSFTSDKCFAALYIVKQYIIFEQEYIDNSISVFLELIRHANFSCELKNKTEEYKVRILESIENKDTLN